MEWFEILIPLSAGILFLWLMLDAGADKNCSDIFEPYGENRWRKVRR